MLNYIKSECYRVMHSRSTYVMTGIMAVLPVLFHIILYVTGVASSTTQDFPYDITSFSFSFLAGSPMLFTYAGLIVAAVLYEDEHKNGNIKNAVAFGISREKLFLGKCMTAVLTATVIMALVLIAYIGSAWFLLEHTGPTSLKIILTEIPAVYGTAVASMILGIALLAYIKNEVMAAMLWAVIVYAIPRVLLMAGMVLLGQWGIEFLWDFAQLLPANLFQFGAKVNMSHCEVLWKTSQGMTKCVIVGIVGTVLAIVAGIVMLRKKRYKRRRASESDQSKFRSDGGIDVLWVLFSVAIVIAVYFATRFFLLKKAMKEANREFQDILKDIQQNQILHMAMPDKELENMAQSVNQALEQIRTERQEYEKRERAFQSEIENISHDLRTPLTVILGYLKLMKGQKETDMEMVETIERKAKTMQRLVTDFYDLSRLSARDYEVEIKETDVGRILRESLMDSYHILEKRALELEAEIPEHIIEVLGDASALERIF